ncbi:MAG: transglycosylase domain-containing protein, partial [Deltaproteobacteria bacterium]|nr:transglycosylase domain-containing protein [Deltaproteobacteria bacterium]
IEWGPDIFGIGAASRHYFGKNPSELKAIEAAYLASVIPNPNRYYTYYFKNEIPDKWYEKIQSILYRMNLFQYLSDDEYNQSLNEKIIFERTALAK